MSVPPIGESYRGPEGRTGYLLRQAWHELRAAMDGTLRPHGLTPAQYSARSSGTVWWSAPRIPPTGASFRRT